MSAEKPLTFQQSTEIEGHRKAQLTNARDGVGSPEIASAPGWPVVLYFHHVCPAACHYTEVTPEQFAYALDLMMARFEAADPSSIESWSIANLTSRPSFFITLDDGYIDNWHWARPVLEERGLRAIFFVVTGAVAQGSSESTRMSWAHLSELAIRGHRIGSHTVSHMDLTRLSPSQARDEINLSFQSIQQNIGVATSLFAYPFGQVPNFVYGNPDLIGFGTIRSPPLPWLCQKHNIRRTFLPSSRCDLWADMIEAWRGQWTAGSPS